MAHVEIHSEIPEENPHKGRVEQAFREALEGDAAAWTVMILLIHGIFWTVFLIRDEDGFRKVLLLDNAREQRPAFIAASIRELLEEVHSDEALPPRGTVAALLH